MKKFDERDHMFSRMNYQVGSEEYEDYYKRNPEKKGIDDTIREMPHMGQEGTVTYNKINSPIVDANFKFLAHIKELSEGEVNPNKVEVDKKNISEKIKEIAKFYGAKLVGICRMKDEFYYSHRGREQKHYGDVVDAKHKYGIVFAVELDKDYILRAPQLPEAIATVKGYTDAAIAGMMVSYYIRELGYDARNHMDGNYLLVAPMVAQEAGLGEIGRSGILITEKYGPRVRLGVVTTELELECDEKVDLGIQNFCEQCGLCAYTCPGKSIQKGSKEIIDGVLRWKINMEECYKRWRSLGTDCGICLCNCPFSMGLSDEELETIKMNGDNSEIIESYKKKYGPRPIKREKLKIEE